MFNFDELNQVREKRDVLDSERFQLAKEAYEDAYACYEDFKDSPSQELLDELQGYLLESLSFQRNQVEPYLLMAELCLAFDLYKEAFAYLKHAESIDAERAEVQAVRRFISSRFHSD